MANLLYPKFKQALLSQSPSIDLDSDTIKISLIRGYTYNAAHDFLDDVTGAGGTLVATATLGSKTVTDGTFDAADVTFPAVAAGAACNMLLVYEDTGVAGTSGLIALYDTATGLPITPNGGDINVTINVSGLFSL